MNSDNQANTRTGKTMAAIGVLFALGLLTLFFQDKLDDLRNPNQQVNSYTSPNGSKEVILLRNNYGQYISSGKINGVGVEFLLDTGAFNVAVSEAVAQQANLRYGPEHQSSTANGITRAWSTTIDQLELGEIVLSNVNASILPNMDDDLILLGMSALRQVEFSQRGNKLTLRYTQ